MQLKKFWRYEACNICMPFLHLCAKIAFWQDLFPQGHEKPLPILWTRAIFCTEHKPRRRAHGFMSLDKAGFIRLGINSAINRVSPDSGYRHRHVQEDLHSSTSWCRCLPDCLFLSRCTSSDVSSLCPRDRIRRKYRDNYQGHCCWPPPIAVSWAPRRSSPDGCMSLSCPDRSTVVRGPNGIASARRHGCGGRRIQVL